MRRQVVQVTGQGVMPDEFGNQIDRFVDADAQIHDSGMLQVALMHGDDVMRRLTFAPGQWDVVDAWFEEDA